MKRPAIEPGRDQLARWILRQRLTQQEAADRIGVSRVKLNQYVNGARRPGLEMAIRLEDLIGIGIRSWLVPEGNNGRQASAPTAGRDVVRD